MSTELTELFEQIILEWIQLNYYDAKKIQQERNKEIITLEKNDRELIHILFLSYHTNIVRYIYKRLKSSHKNSMIQYIIHYHQDICRAEDILDQTKIDDMSYLIQYMVCICIKTPAILTMILQTFEDFENEIVVLK
jgi:hypothetical protein